MFDHGLTTSMKDPHFTDLPLGPLAGATLRYTLTRRGAKLHGNHQCGETAKPDATIQDFPQPHSGTLGDLNLPGNAHCHLDQASAAYITTARDIASLRAENTEAKDIWNDGGFPIQITKAATMTDHDEPSAQGPTAALRDAWRRTKEERKALIEEIIEARWQADRALQLAIAARWVAAGRRPRAYDPQFDLFLAQADRALRLDGFTATLAMRNFATEFLTSVGEGHSLDSTARKLLAAAENKPMHDASGLKVVLHTWGAILHGIVQAHRQPCVALLEYEPHRWPISLHDVFMTLSGGARFSGGGQDWAICEVPGVYGLLLQSQRDSGHMRSEARRVALPPYSRPEAWAEALSQIVTTQGGPELASTVTTVTPGELPFSPPLEPSSLPVKAYRRPGTQIRPIRDLGHQRLINERLGDGT